MSVGLPIIASNVGGNKEAVIHEHNGFVFDLKNQDDFYNSMKVLITNKELRETFGKNSIKLIDDKFNIDYCANEYISLYNKYLNTNE